MKSLLVFLLSLFKRQRQDLEKRAQEPVERDVLSTGYTEPRDIPLVVPERGDPEETAIKDAINRKNDDMTIRTSLLGCCEMIAKEAVILNRYLDSENIWTIGPGITHKANVGIDPRYFKGVITLERAVTLFEKALPQYEGFVYGLMGSKARAGELLQHEFDALVSLAYNAGNINKPMTRGLARSGDIAGAIDIWRANRSLWSRRDKEVALARTGVYSAKTIPVGMADPNGLVIKSSFKYMRIATLIEKLNASGGFA